MKKYILLSLLCVQVFTLSSKSMVEIWKTMPDSLLMLVDRTQRLEMPNFISMGLKGEVTNTLQGKSRMDTLTANYIHLTLTKSSSMQIKRLEETLGVRLLDRAGRGVALTAAGEQVYRGAEDTLNTEKQLSPPS